MKASDPPALGRTGAARARFASGLLCGAFALCLLLAGTGSVARADGDLRWRSEPALAPPPPAGVAPAPYPVPLGHVGQISFWVPNRGLLITGGTEEERGSVPAGVYAYDGESWHQLSTECGGGEGRIAWAGPDEFWTISDQRPGQVLASGSSSVELHSISLCHFLNGQVVGSYAMPLEETGSYRHMDAAACYSPSDCWFGGEDGVAPNIGAFHLHWNGSTVSTIYEPEDHAITSMALFDGELYESVRMGEHDAFLPGESTEHPAAIHTIAAGDEPGPCGGAESVFCDVTIFTEGDLLPEYGKGVLPDALQGFDLATEGLSLEAGSTQMWAAANPVTVTGSTPASVTVLRDEEGNWSQVIPGKDGESPLEGGASLAGAGRGTSDAIAPEPGSESAWLSLAGGGEQGVAEVARLDAAGVLSQPSEPVTLPEADEPIGYRGEAGPIVCPAAQDCWLATTDEAGPTPGWLFHLSDGMPLPRNDDPFFDGEDGVIKYRPPDSGVPVIYPDLPPVDDSLANQQPAPAPSKPPAQTVKAPAVRKAAKPLLEHVKSKVLAHRTLMISFTLTGRAHVQLLGRRKRKVVASTRLELLSPGHHELSLRLNPTRWPTSILFHATPIEAAGQAEDSVPEAEGGPEATEKHSSSDTLET